MKLIRKMAVFITACALALLNVAAPAQTYPINNPSYIPTAVLAATTFTAAGTATFNNNGNGTVLIRVAGTNSVLSAVVQITESRAASPTWTTVPVQLVGGGVVTTITANGLYRLNINGAAQVRFNLASLTGTNVIVSAAATPGSEFVEVLPVVRSTYAASAVITPAGSATDLLQISGSASKTVKVQSLTCTHTATAAGVNNLVALKRSAANTGGTTAAATAVGLDSTFPTPAASVVTYSANPTTGALVGNLAVRAAGASVPTGTMAAVPVVFDFGSTDRQGVVLRGTAETFALNGAAASFPTGATLQCALRWTEE